MIKSSVILPALLVGGVAHAKLNYTRTGQGPAIVLLHSLGGTHADWSREIERLAKTHTIIAIDLPGHGQSPAPPAIALDDVARSIASVIRAERLAPAVIVGHSMGGTIAAHVPLVDAGAARALVIVDSLIGAFPIDARERLQLRHDVARDHDGTLRAFYQPMTTPELLPRVLKSAHALDGKTWASYLDAAATQPVPDGGRALTLPVLLMVSRDLVAKPEQQAKIVVDAGYAHVAQLTVTRFETLHWIQWEQPEAFDRALDDFLARVEKP